MSNKPQEKQIPQEKYEKNIRKIVDIQMNKNIFSERNRNLYNIF